MAAVRTVGEWLVDEPIQIGPHRLRGRIYLPAHQPGLADGGHPGSRYVAYHRERARAGVAMQVTGATPIKPSSEWSDICLWNVDESIVPGYRRLAEAVRAEGGRMLAQLAHPGPTETEGAEVIGASRDFSEVSRQVAVPASKAQLDEVVELYAAAADRCRRGELDGVEISMAHGLLLASFISPLTNHRDDEYGGDFERRLTLPIRVLDAVREAIGPELILGIRLGVDDLVEGGLRPDDAALVARALQSRVDYISVMVGNNNRLEARVRHWPPTPAPPGLFREAARTIKQAVDVPVCAVGRITTAALANDLLVAGDADLVGMVRAQIADADLLGKTRRGQVADIRPCVGANVCVNQLLAARPLACLVNPDAGSPGRTVPEIDVAGRRAVVIGAGPGGLEAARRLGLLGYDVTVFERDSAVGGQMGAWSRAPSRREVSRYLRWQERQLAALGVSVRLGIEATVDDVRALEPDLVVAATGAAPAPLTVAENDGSIRIVDAVTALHTSLEGDVLVFDEIGELDGALIAERLAVTPGVHVTLATSRLHLGEGEGINTLYPMIRRLAEIGVDVVERVRPSALANGQVRLDGVFGEAGRTVQATTLVPWCGGTPRVGLIDQLRSVGLHPVVIGDALRPRRALHATQEAKQYVDELARRQAAYVSASVV
jgi:2,4-dienoyl-CoA reductase-like NADH-dependent reductase (Old Yellow Enzyme family)